MANNGTPATSRKSLSLPFQPYPKVPPGGAIHTHGFTCETTTGGCGRLHPDSRDGCAGGTVRRAMIWHSESDLELYWDTKAELPRCQGPMRADFEVTIYAPSPEELAELQALMAGDVTPETAARYHALVGSQEARGVKRRTTSEVLAKEL